MGLSVVLDQSAFQAQPGGETEVVAVQELRAVIPRTLAHRYGAGVEGKHALQLRLHHVGVHEDFPRIIEVDIVGRLILALRLRQYLKMEELFVCGMNLSLALKVLNPLLASTY